MTSGQHVSYGINEFLKISDSDKFTGELQERSQQTRTWDEEFKHLQNELGKLSIKGIKGRIIFEYGISGLNSVIDVVLLTAGKIFVIEYKTGDSSNEYSAEDLKQCRNYALRLKYFHNTSSDRWIIPILVEMEARKENINKEKNEELLVWGTIKCNKDNLAATITEINNNLQYKGDNCWEDKWEEGVYKATPTIIKAACEMWERQNVKGLDSGESDKDTRLAAEDCIMKIVEEAEKETKKSIVFVTGVPGAGKTLVGLGLSARCQNYGASMLSGNDPLVRVLSTALRRDLDKQYKDGKLKDEIKDKYEKEKKETASISVDAIIRTAYAYKQEIINSRLNWNDETYQLLGADKGSQHVIIFDEAQRAWDRDKMLSPGQSGKKDWQYKTTWPFSEPGLLLWDMNQRDWGVFVCLVGGGQEINTGEAGIVEWLKVLATDDRYKDWQVYMSNRLIKEKEYQRSDSEGNSLQVYCKKLNGRLRKKEELHLTESQRSIRNNKVSEFINNLLSCETEKAQKLYKKISLTYKIYLTRDVQKAKEKLKEMKSKGEYPEETRMGMLMSSEAARMRPLGYEIKKVRDYLKKTPNWFLDPHDHVSSSDSLEVALNEFFVQGLEVDYAAVLWDGDFRYNRKENNWEYYCFNETYNKWSKKDKKNDHKQDIKRFYMKNAYRVLLTRARLGMVICVPEGNPDDRTRLPEFYNGTYDYLKGIGLTEIS